MPGQFRSSPRSRLNHISLHTKGGTMISFKRRTFIAACIAALGAAAVPAALAADTIKIGLVTALSGQSAQAGEAITRGLTVAIDEINAKGGLLGGRKLELVRRDDE